jgi:hypothetical protein
MCRLDAGEIGGAVGVAPDINRTMPSLATPPLLAALASARRVLLAGAGGGFDVYAALPLAIALWDQGVEVHLGRHRRPTVDRVRVPEDRIEPTHGAHQVAGRIAAFRDGITPKIPRAYPH